MKEEAHSAREKTKRVRERANVISLGNDKRMEVESEEVKGEREIEWM